MIYFLAIIFGLAAAFMTYASEIAAGNIGHLENGRELNGGAAILRRFLFFLSSLSYLLGCFAPSFPSELLRFCSVPFCFSPAEWCISFVRLRARFWRLEAMRGQPKQSAANVQ